MKRIGTAGLCLIAVIMLSSVAAGSAVAAGNGVLNFAALGEAGKLLPPGSPVAFNINPETLGQAFYPSVACSEPIVLSGQLANNDASKVEGSLAASSAAVTCAQVGVPENIIVITASGFPLSFELATKAKPVSEPFPTTYGYTLTIKKGAQKLRFTIESIRSGLSRGTCVYESAKVFGDGEAVFYHHEMTLFSLATPKSVAVFKRNKKLSRAECPGTSPLSSYFKMTSGPEEVIVNMS
jgi:hypothetical protein